MGGGIGEWLMGRGLGGWMGGWVGGKDRRIVDGSVHRWLGDGWVGR